MSIVNSYKKLLNNSLIFAIGNLGSKFIVLILVPLYTYYLTKSEYGLIDLLTTTISFIVPIITLSIVDAVLRFAMDHNYDKKEVLINSLMICLIGFFVLVIIFPLLKIILPFNKYILYFYLIILSQIIDNTLSQYIRAKEMIRLFAFSGIINAITLLISNVLLLMVLNKGITGYLVSIVVSNLVRSLLLLFRANIVKDIHLDKINISLVKEMLYYSIPLIPNALMWWIMSLSDRYLITYFLGLSANGLYAVANKVPSILSIAHSIFFQAWQMAAIEEVESKDKSQFFSNVFNIFWLTMFILTSLLLVFLKLIINVFIAEEYFESWKYIPFLLLGVVFSSFSGFLGVNYIASKKTSGVFKTSIIGAVINFITNILLIPTLGINGASIATMLSFLVIWLLRIKDTKDFVIIKIKWKTLWLSFFILMLQIGVLYVNYSTEFIVELFLFLSILLVNIQQIKKILLRYNEPKKLDTK
ncbi:oligosaccharide flippase family protein [Caldifermentibacillus hisashii]|uniref:oligosaccharide flippase family protein n=1 Tax=Caldifermentibacillus hisashii TaxID=996558 RepID=UPI001FD2E56E|nr:polysaccharide biosynthesis C-terminal domain-containing protein [Caldifermentibacillus hisashii]